MTIISNKFVNLFYIGIVSPLLFFSEQNKNSIVVSTLLSLILGLVIIFTGKPKIELTMNDMLKIFNWTCVIPVISCILMKNQINLIDETIIKNIGLSVGAFHIVKYIMH